MKKLTKLKLINWHYFKNEEINFGSINFLTGRNSSGKSTIIDALQVVLMGETRSSAFNRAAGKGSDRTLKGYLIGSLTEDINKGARSLRGGKDFNSYIAAEFYDDVKDEYFCLIAGFSVSAAEEVYYKRFFYIKEKLSLLEFIKDNRTVDVQSFARRYKELYGSRFFGTDTVKSYQDKVLMSTGVFDPKFFSTLKKSISFEPINDIEKFITENICDIEDNIDITNMQENIRNYRQQEEIAKKFEEKLTDLEKICEIYSKLEMLRNRLEIQQYLTERSSLEYECDKLKEAENEKAILEQKAAELSEIINQLTEQKKIQENEKDELSRKIAQFNADTGLDIIENKIEQTNISISETDRHIGKICETIHIQSAQWGERTTSCAKSRQSEKLIQKLEELTVKLNFIKECKNSLFEKTSVKFFYDANDLFSEITEELRPAFSQLKSEKEGFEAEKTVLLEEIEKLKKGIKSFPPKAQQLKSEISAALYKKYGKEIEVSFLAEKIDVAAPEWRDAIEGYLNTQRMNIIVAPEFFTDAYHTYKRIQRKEKIHGYAVVDLEKVYAAKRVIVAESLSSVVSTDDKYVEAYVEYLLGRVRRCDDDRELRDYPASITKECMLYKGYAVSALNQEAYLTPYIGQAAIERQLEIKQAKLIEVENAINDAAAQISFISPFCNNEWFLSGSVIDLSVKQGFDFTKKKAALHSELDRLISERDSIDILYVTRLKDDVNIKSEEIARTEEKIKKNEKEKILTEDRAARIEKETIPETKSAISLKQKDISEKYPEDFITETGEPRFKSEMSRLGEPKRIIDSFAPNVKRTETDIRREEENLCKSREEYVRKNNISYGIIDCSQNDEYSSEYTAIKDIELPRYRENIEKAKEDAMEQFKSDFLYRLKSNIESVFEQKDELNKAIKKYRFGTDSFKFDIRPNPAYIEYYDMIMSPMLETAGISLYSYEFQERYRPTIESLFSQIISLSGDDTAVSSNVEMFSRYKTYLTFDLLSTDETGNTEKLSKSIGKKSGGEVQTPFYIAVLASFAQLYHINEKSKMSNSIRLIIFDEAFNKMDSDRIEESIRLLRSMGFQAIFCSPSNKAGEIAPFSEKTLLVDKQVVSDGYRSVVVEWTKEMGEIEADEEI